MRKAILILAVAFSASFALVADNAKSAVVSTQSSTGTPVLQAAAPEAAAQVAQETSAPEAETTAVSRPSPWGGMMPMIIIFAVLIIWMSWSNKRQAKKRQQQLDALVKGSKVMLNSGVFGKITEVQEKSFLVEIADNVKVEVLKSAVSPVDAAPNGTTAK